MLGRSDGRSYVRDPSSGKTTYVSQLVAIACGYDATKVFTDGYEVHHCDGQKWRNARTNLALLSEEKHRGIHAIKNIKE